MKKIFMAIALLTVTLGMMLSFCSCTLPTAQQQNTEEEVDDGSKAPKPELDLSDAQDNLEDEGYEVQYITDLEEMGNSEMVGITSLLFANDGDEGLNIYVCDTEEMAKYVFEQYRLMVKKQAIDMKYNIEIGKHLKENNKKEFTDSEYEALKDSIDSYEEQYERFEDDEYVVGRSGKKVWFGTKTAIDASKG